MVNKGTKTKGMISKTMKVGEFTRARIVGVQGHDLIAQPI
jgi:ribosomal protein S12 methylthiotransferase